MSDEENSGRSSSSLENMVIQRIKIAIHQVNGEEVCESMKEVMDLVRELMIRQALQSTMKVINEVPKIESWREQQAALVLGITHKQLKTGIKQFEIQAPDNGQATLL